MRPHLAKALQNGTLSIKERNDMVAAKIGDRELNFSQYVGDVGLVEG